MGKRLRCTVDCLNERYALKTVEREELLERKMGKRLGWPFVYLFIGVIESDRESVRVYVCEIVGESDRDSVRVYVCK